MSNPATTPAREQAKAILGGILAGLTALGTALADGVVSPVEVVGITIALLATYGTVFGVENKGTLRRNEGGWTTLLPVFPASEYTRAALNKRIPNPFKDDERGQGGVLYVLLVVLVVLAILALVGVL